MGNFFRKSSKKVNFLWKWNKEENLYQKIFQKRDTKMIPNRDDDILKEYDHGDGSGSINGSITG